MKKLKNYENYLNQVIPNDKDLTYNIVCKDKSRFFKKKNIIQKVFFRIFPKKNITDKPEFIPINQSQWEELCIYAEAINIYNKFDISWNLLIDNFNHLHLFLTQELSSKEILIDFEKQGYLRTLNFKFINAVSAIYIFYNNIIGLIEENFDDNIKEEVKFFFNELYDNSFAYRFCFQLRGYVNHRYLPFEILHTNLSNNEVSLFLDSHKLLNSSYKWNAKVRKEMEDIEHISVKDVLLELNFHLLKNFEKLSNIFKKQIFPFTEILGELDLKNIKYLTYETVLRVSWQENLTTEEIEKLKQQIFVNENLGKNNKYIKFIETNLNLATYKFLEGSFGYSLAPMHFAQYFDGLRKKLSK